MDNLWTVLAIIFEPCKLQKFSLPWWTIFDQFWLFQACKFPYVLRGQFVWTKLAFQACTVNFNIFSNHGGQFVTSFGYLRHVNLKMFSNHGWTVNLWPVLGTYLRHVNFKIFFNHGGQFVTSFGYLSHVNFKIFSNHGGQFVTSFSYFIQRG